MILPGHVYRSHHGTLLGARLHERTIEIRTSMGRLGMCGGTETFDIRDTLAECDGSITYVAINALAYRGDPGFRISLTGYPDAVRSHKCFAFPVDPLGFSESVAQQKDLGWIPVDIGVSMSKFVLQVHDPRMLDDPYRAESSDHSARFLMFVSIASYTTAAPTTPW